MKVIICGGRNFSDWQKGFMVLDEIHNQTRITEVIHGCARGADAMAEQWAFGHIREGVKCRGFRAEWDKYDNAAGPIRNGAMLRENPDAVIAFPGGRGTADMVRQALAAGIKVIEPMKGEIK